MKELRPYQRRSMEIMSQDSSCLDGSDMGTGKTLVGTERIRLLETGRRPPRVLIVAPIVTHRQWRATLAEQYPSLASSPSLRIVGTPGSDPESWKMLTSKQPGVYIIGWEAMRGSVPRSRYRHLFSSRGKHGKLTVRAVDQAVKDGLVPPWTRTGTWDLVILDEVHRMVRRDSLTRLVIRKIKTQNKLAASATPAGRKPEGLWTVLNWLWPEKYSSFWNWAREWLVIEDEPFQKIIGEKKPGTTWVDIPCKVRWRISRVADQLPEVIERTVTVPMGDRQREIYEDFESQAFVWLDEHPIAAGLPIAQRTRLRQAALGQLKGTAGTKRVTEWVSPSFLEQADPEADIQILEKSDDGKEIKVSFETDCVDIDFAKTGDQPKLEAIKDIIEDLPENEPVLVFTHSARWAVMAAEALDKEYGPARHYTGAVSKKERERIRDGLGTSVRIIVAQLASIAEGTDGLQHVCRCEIWASPSEDSLINEQATGRLHRPGQTSPVQRWVLHSEDSIDTDVAETLEGRRKKLRAMYRDKS